MALEPDEEINAKIAELVDIAFRRQQESLEQITQAAQEYDYEAVASLALAYAGWVRVHKGYQDLLMPERGVPLQVVK